MLLFPFLSSVATCRLAEHDLIFVSRSDNDLYRTFSRSKRVSLSGRLDIALKDAKVGSGILILDGEPWTSASQEIAVKKDLKFYRELPVDGPKSKSIEWERVFVASNQFGDALKLGRILSVGRQPMAISSAPNPLLSIGRIAGFDSLAFGPPNHSDPLLWLENDRNMLSAVPISRFSTARYAPAKAWKPVIQHILTWLGAPSLASQFVWKPEVRPMFGPNEDLPSDVENGTARAGAKWFTQSHLILTHDDVETYMKADQWPDRIGPQPIGNSDGINGIIEGYSSAIDAKGNQPVRYYRRADCNAESAMALTLAGGERERKIGENLGDYIAFKSKVLHNDPTKQTFGLVGWNDQENNRGNFYGDDNARYILGLIGTAGALKTRKYDDQILACILANFRTTGTNGFRGDNLSESDIERLGWKHFFDAPTINMAPHFEAYNWALYLWAYQKTGYSPLLTRSIKAITRCMDSGENAWTWTNGIQQERARMLLPLSWLVRVENTPLHRKWLTDVAHEVIRHQDACGAIREEIGDLSHGIAGPPRSNEAFGTAETPLIQNNGDPVADMLYTSNFAFLGLHEAASSTHDPAIVEAENKLAKFLCRIQVRSETHPELNGAWFRAFDFGDWNYWASNADLGWGTWSIETGWSVSWITSLLAIRQRHVSFWDIHPTFAPNLELVKKMLS